MPAIESCHALLFVLRRYWGLVERGVARMLELGLGQSLVVVDRAIAYKLNLGYPRDSLKIGVQDGLLCVLSLVIPMTIILRFWIERLQEIKR